MVAPRLQRSSQAEEVKWHMLHMVTHYAGHEVGFAADDAADRGKGSASRRPASPRKARPLEETSDFSTGTSDNALRIDASNT